MITQNLQDMFDNISDNRRYVRRKMSDDTRQKMSLAKQGKKRGPMSQEQKNKLRITTKSYYDKKGRKQKIVLTEKERLEKSKYWLGKTRSEETKAKMREGMRLVWKNRPRKPREYKARKYKDWTIDKIIPIVKEYKKGQKTLRELAKKYNVSYKIIWIWNQKFGKD